MFSFASHRFLASQKIVEFVFILRCQMNNTMSARKVPTIRKVFSTQFGKLLCRGKHHGSEPGQDNINALHLCVRACVRARERDQMIE